MLDKISWNQPWFVYVVLDCPGHLCINFVESYLKEGNSCW